MASVSLTTFRTLVRERADMVGSSFVSDAATGIDKWINEGISELHSKLVSAYGDEYAESTQSITTVVGTTDYALASDFYKLYEADISLNGYTRPLHRYTRAERNSYRNASSVWEMTPRYKLAGSYIRILPATVATTVTLRYAPQATILVNAGDTVNFPNSWEKYVVVYAAMQALMKEESPVSHLAAMLERWDREFKELIENRDLNEPVSAVDVDAMDPPRFW